MMFPSKIIDDCNRLLSSPNSRGGCHSSASFGFFFDGMACELTGTGYGENRTNIAKLWSVFRDDSVSNDFQHFRRFYFSGLGTDLDVSFAAGIGGGVHRAPGEAVSGIEGQAQGSASEGGQALLTSKDGRPWYETFSKTFKDSFTDWKGWLKEVRNGLVRAGMEVAGPLRDNSFSAHLLMSGAPTRLDLAERTFKNEVATIMSLDGPPLGAIRVSVFGFDFGGALGKRFVRNLLENVCSESDGKYFYEGVEVVVEFAGFFDCVDRTHQEMGPFDWMHPLTPVLDDGSDLHPAVRKVLHLVAAHERRFYRRCRTIGQLNVDWKEELFPGISPDVGGGLGDDVGKSGVELSTVALHRMYRAAYRASVPFPHLDDLAEVDHLIAQQFRFTYLVGRHSMLGLVRRYESFMDSYRTPDEEAFRAHTLLYLYWQSQRFVEYRSAKAFLEGSQDELPGWMRRRVGAFVSALTDATEDRWELIQAEHERLEAALNELENSWGWLNQVDDEAKDLIRRFESPDPATARHARQALHKECAMAYRWRAWVEGRNRLDDIPEEVMLLFSYGMHDMVPEQMDFRAHQRTSLFHGYRYFTIRGLDRPG